jgi:hypothetical protein
MMTFRCLECGRSSPSIFEFGRCCSEECHDAFTTRYAEEQARRHAYATAERNRLEAQAARERRARRSFRQLYPC